MGSFNPTSRCGNRYIPKMMNMVTRYLDTLPIRTCDTIHFAERMVWDVFSVWSTVCNIQWQGPKIYIKRNDRSILLSMKHLNTTPCQLICNRFIERFSGTVFQMTGGMCQERPVNWYRYCSALLHAYSEFPKPSLGFAPLGTIYERRVRAPLKIRRTCGQIRQWSVN